MKYLSLVFCIALFSALTNPLFGQAAGEKPKEYVGEVIIVGNTITQDRVIRAEIIDLLIPGQPFLPGDLTKAEENLARLQLFKKSLSVKALASDGPFKDILVKVEEANARRMKWEFNSDHMGRPVVRLIMQDRNFDPFRYPTSVSDIEEALVFRGGGQKVRIEVLRINILETKIEFFPNGLIIPALIRPLFEN